MTVKFWVYFAPFWVPIALMLTRRVSISVAALGAAASALVLYVYGVAPQLDTMAEAVGLELLKGVWLAVPIVSVILAGLLFHTLLSRLWLVPRRDPPSINAPDLDAARSTLFGACFLIGPFAEAATGFGVGLVICLGILLGLGLRKTDAIVFSLFSQTLVVWGAFAVGTMLGTTLSGMADPRDLGWRSAVLMSPIMMGWLVAFWVLCRRSGLPGTAACMVKEALWVLAILIGLNALGRYLDPDVIGLIVLGSLAATYSLISRQGVGVALGTKLTRASPYMVLSGLLVASRLSAPVHEALAGVSVSPVHGAKAWAPLLSPAFWLLVVGLAFTLRKRTWSAVGDIACQTWLRGRVTVGVTLLFVVCAQLMISGNVPEVLAGELQATVGASSALMLSPILAAIAGFLTASNAASNSLLMPGVSALAVAHAANTEWIAAIQNVTGSALSMLSPVRVMMGCAIAGVAPVTMGLVYRQAWVLGVIPVVVMIGAAVIVVM